MDVAFGLPGVHNLALWRALGASPIRLVGVRHEQTAAYAADGYARATGRLGVALDHHRPGRGQHAGAVGEAWASRQPILVIATDIPTTAAPPRRVARRAARGHRPGGDVRAGGEGGVPGALGARAGRRGGARRSATALAPARAARLSWRSRPTCCDRRRARIARGRPRRSCTGARRGPAGPGGARSLAHARRPLIWAGGGALQAGAGEAVARLAERLVAPVMLTYSARGLLPPDHPAWSRSPRTCPRPAPSGTRPTWWSRSAPTSTA